jgi:hypothetical protein
VSLVLKGAHGKVVRTLLACVVRVDAAPPKPNEEGKWVLGCNFIGELTDQEMRALV